MNCVSLNDVACIEKMGNEVIDNSAPFNIFLIVTDGQYSHVAIELIMQLPHTMYVSSHKICR